MLKIYVDIRRLLALHGNKALKQQVHARRINFGDEQAVTDGRIGRRTSALAENLLATSKLHDVLYGEKIMFVVQLGNEVEFFFDERNGVVGYAVRPALVRAIVGELTQIGARR